MKNLCFPALLLALILQACTATKPVISEAERLRTDPGSITKAFGVLYYKQGLEMMERKNYSEAAAQFHSAEPFIRDEKVFTKLDRALLFNATGKSFFFANQFDSALTLFRHALAADTGFYEAYNNTGYIKFIQRDYDAALSLYQQALAIKPTYSLAKENIDLANRFKAGDISWESYALFAKAEKINGLEDKIKIYTRLLETTPLYVEGINNLAVALYQSGQAGDEERAMGFLRQATVIDRKYAMARNNLGFMLYQQGRTAEAIEEYLIAVSLKDEFTLALLNLAGAYYDTGDYEKSRKYAADILKYDARNSDALRRIEMCNLLLSPPTNSAGEDAKTK
ncbi:MAG: tetratricopeptide repeat protein [Rhizobacter sp.]|nr:tetratricopeptide repeat protein [Chlorobiales bacterium]